MLVRHLDVIRLPARAWAVPIPPYLALAAAPQNFHDTQQQLRGQK